MSGHSYFWTSFTSLYRRKVAVSFNITDTQACSQIRQIRGGQNFRGAIVNGKQTELIIANRWRHHFENGVQQNKRNEQIFLFYAPTCDILGHISRKRSPQKLSNKFIGTRSQFGGSCPRAFASYRPVLWSVLYFTLLHCEMYNINISMMRIFIK